MIQTCGFCGGHGTVANNPYDNTGHYRCSSCHWCEYCGGSGQVEDGNRLLPAPTYHPTDEPSGLPPWA